MESTAKNIACRLANDAEFVCRHYLSNGRKQGRYWIVGDVQNMPGRSLYVRLTGPTSGPGAAGKWTDAQSGLHGDLLGPMECRLSLFAPNLKAFMRHIANADTNSLLNRCQFAIPYLGRNFQLIRVSFVCWGHDLHTVLVENVDDVVMQI